MTKNLLPSCLALLLVLLTGTAHALTASPIPASAGAYLIILNGQPLWSHEPNRRLPQASLTKIMTALLVLEQGGLDRVVTVSKEAAAETGSTIGLRPGERLRIRDLLAAALISSANDACHALAEAVDGTQEAFIDRMNRKARALGLTDSHFADVSGHDREDHYSSARDLASLAETAMKQPLFRTLVAVPQLRILTVDRGRTFRLRNHNRLIGKLDGIRGIKTGYTRGAGRCLVALVERGNSRVLLVLLNAPHRWEDARKLVEAAFNPADGPPRTAQGKPRPRAS